MNPFSGKQHESSRKAKTEETVRRENESDSITLLRQAINKHGGRRKNGKVPQAIHTTASMETRQPSPYHWSQNDEKKDKRTIGS